MNLENEAEVRPNLPDARATLSKQNAGFTPQERMYRAETAWRIPTFYSLIDIPEG